MSGICRWLNGRQGIKRSSDDVRIEVFFCAAIPLSRDKGITVDEFETYCIKCYEECSRYQKMEKMEKLGEKIDHVGNFFRRK